MVYFEFVCCYIFDGCAFVQDYWLLEGSPYYKNLLVEGWGLKVEGWGLRVDGWGLRVEGLCLREMWGMDMTIFCVVSSLLFCLDNRWVILRYWSRLGHVYNVFWSCDLVILAQKNEEDTRLVQRFDDWGWRVLRCDRITCGTVIYLSDRSACWNFIL